VSRECAIFGERDGAYLGLDTASAVFQKTDADIEGRPVTGFDLAGGRDRVRSRRTALPFQNGKAPRKKRRR
jgi:hypothetical protein